jgi:predicted nucleic acid-binding protein
MPPIVADTTPLNYLVLIEAVEVLPRLYGSVLIPPSVLAELSDRYAPVQVRTGRRNLRDDFGLVEFTTPGNYRLKEF